MDTANLSNPRAIDALKEAAAARNRAYAPYSRFKMGAGVVTEAGAVVPGALVENVSLGLAMCAERAALFATVATDAGKPEVLALVARRTKGELTWPCGACLQVALELGGPDLLVVASDGRRVAEARLRDLAPRLPFKGAR
jgi:cytidine deaminase